MEVFAGYLRELVHQVDHPIQYRWTEEETSYGLNGCLNQTMTIRFTGRKACIHCGRKVKKLYQNGYCFPCVTTLAECDLCIVKPHECHFHLGTCRDETFAASHCMIPHYVYIAYSSSVKVGLTRKGREFRRWVDQGAVMASIIGEVPTRKMAGELEMAIAQHIPDKTDWRKMLREDTQPAVDLTAVREDIRLKLDADMQQLLYTDSCEVHQFRYPRVTGAEVKLTSISLDKDPVVVGTVLGVKGQYILLDHGVFNVKKHAGYEIEVSVS